MAIELSWTDRDYITRAVATEADHKLAKSDPDAYRSQVAGIVDTILNRVASPQYPDTVADVVNQYGQFSAINGPARSYRVYGSVDQVPNSVVPAGLSGIVNEWVNARIEGAPSSVGGHLNYANIGYSEGQRWLNDLDGPQYGAGNSVHNHGTAQGGTPVEAVVGGQLYNGEGKPLPPGYIPEVMTLVDLNDPSARIAQRVNAMWDAASPVPEARSQATLARTKAMLAQPRPVHMPESVRSIRELNDTPPTPRPPAEAELARDKAATPSAPNGRQLLPTIGPAGTTRQDPVGSMPSSSELTQLRSPRPVTSKPASAPGQSGMVGQDAVAPPPASVSAPRPVTRPPISYAAQEGAIAPQSGSPSVRRVAAPDPTTMAGNVAMPSGARPAVADALVRQAETAAAKGRLETKPQSYAGQERATGTTKTAGDRPMSYAGEERAAPHVASDATSLSWPPASPSRAQLTMADQSYAGQERAPGLSSGRKGPSVEAASPAEVPKYVTTSTKVPVEAKTAASAKGEIPLGDVRHNRSRDSAAQEQAGKAFAESDKFRTITETVLNPKWIEQQRDLAQAAAPGVGPGKVQPPKQTPAIKPGEDLTPLERVRTTIGLPPQGVGGMLGDGIRNVIGLGNSRHAPAPPVGTALGIAANGGRVVQGKGGAMNSITQGSEAWQKATGNEPRYTSNGNGSFTSESGGVYYDRHLR